MSAPEALGAGPGSGSEGLGNDDGEGQTPRRRAGEISIDDSPPRPLVDGDGSPFPPDGQRYRRRVRRKRKEKGKKKGKGKEKGKGKGKEKEKGLTVVAMDPLVADDHEHGDAVLGGVSGADSPFPTDSNGSGAAIRGRPAARESPTPPQGREAHPVRSHLRFGPDVILGAAATTSDEFSDSTPSTSTGQPSTVPGVAAPGRFKDSAHKEAATTSTPVVVGSAASPLRRVNRHGFMEMGHQSPERAAAEDQHANDPAKEDGRTQKWISMLRDWNTWTTAAKKRAKVRVGSARGRARKGGRGGGGGSGGRCEMLVVPGSPGSPEASVVCPPPRSIEQPARGFRW